MKYILNKDLPTFKAGIEAWMSEHGNLVTEEDGEILVIYSAQALAKFPNILTEWFTPVEEKRKVVPDLGENYFVIPSYGEVSLVVSSEHSFPTINQGNWRWTQEEAELEVAKRAAIERVRRYLVENDLLEEDKSRSYCNIVYSPGNNKLTSIYPLYHRSYYSPYGRIKDTDPTQFIDDCREDLLMIHS